MTIKKRVPMSCVRFAALTLRSFPRFLEYPDPAAIRTPRAPSIQTKGASGGTFAARRGECGEGVSSQSIGCGSFA